MKPFTIAFDLDGTLVDTAPDLMRSVGLLLQRKNLAPVADTELRPLISYGSRVMLKHAYKVLGVSVPPEKFEAWWHEYLDIYANNISVASRPFAGLVPVLDRLKGRGVTVAVCTNKTEAMSRRLLADLGLLDRFAALAGRDTFAFCKPDPRHLTETIARAGGDVARALMVGDSDVDIDTARAARIPVIGVTFGYCHVPVTTFAPDAVISHYDEFDGVLHRLCPDE